MFLQLTDYCNEYLTCENPNTLEAKHSTLLKEYDSKFASIKMLLPKTDEGWNAVFADFQF